MSVSISTSSPKKTEEVSVSERKTVTNWAVFDKAGLVPVRIKCDGYLGGHPSDLSCHSNILTTSESVQHHMKPEHGGGWFHFRLRSTDAKGKATIWRDLSQAGVEISHLYCPHCRREVEMTPREILFHLNPHPGANRVNIYPATLCMSLSYGMPQTEELVDDPDAQF